ncbi:Sodium/hydrogen exchanger family-domain-containing protein [Phlyctochytrium arcticum]|nr:Sodium/hydrogen exchanger family-domain-containing protein [Phlyctochytrium arcticum]
MVHTGEPSSEEDRWATGALLIYTTLLAAILLTSYYLQLRKVRFIHETVVSLVLGLIVGGLVVRLGSSGDGSLTKKVTFDYKYFFNLLLPPIILNSGYDMKRQDFFRNIGAILTFALVGTVMSTVIIGVSIYLWTALLNVMFNTGFVLSKIDSIVFGAILSSTDPVTILAIFHQLRVDPKLYAIIFGESILNDSVAIVLFKVLDRFRNKEITVGNIGGGISLFLAVFIGSILVGIILALICALMLKHSELRRFPALESSLVALLAYSAYLLSNSVQLSGIVSLLFCGICLKHYAYNNMSLRTRRTTKYMFRVLSQLSENFVFIYLGVTVFTNWAEERFHPLLILFTLGICLVARYLCVIPLSSLINAVARRLRPQVLRPEIPRNHQLMLWWAGLRGAIAFALSFEMNDSTPEAKKTAQVIQTTTLVVCIVTVILLGGTTNTALQRLGIKTGVGSQAHENEDDAESDDEWEGASGPNASPSPTQSNDDAFNPINNSMDDDGAARPWNQDDTTHWFIGFDNKWLKPLFTSRKAGWQESGSQANSSQEHLLRERYHSPREIPAPLDARHAHRAFGRAQSSSFNPQSDVHL